MNPQLVLTFRGRRDLFPLSGVEARFLRLSSTCPSPALNKTVIEENNCRIRHETSGPLHINSRDVPCITLLYRDANGPCPALPLPLQAIRITLSNRPVTIPHFHNQLSDRLVTTLHPYYQAIIQTLSLYLYSPYQAITQTLSSYCTPLIMPSQTTLRRS